MLGVQGPSGSNGPPPPRPGHVVNAPQLPIDENIWILIGIGVLLGIYIIYRRGLSTSKVS